MVARLTLPLGDKGRKDPHDQRTYIAVMEIIEEITERRARRALSERPIDPDVLERVFTAATLAPSCFNNQPWRFLVCNEGEALAKARECLIGGNYWARQAPVLLAVLTGDELDCNLSDERHYAQFDTGMATMNLMLQATREGLYAHPMAGFNPVALREAFGIGAETRVITMLALGYPGSSDHLSEKHLSLETSARVRRPLGEVVLMNEWNGQGTTP